jgi:hypothetical protein
MMLELRMVDYNYQLVNESIKISESWSNNQLWGIGFDAMLILKFYFRIETQETWKLDIIVMLD